MIPLLCSIAFLAQADAPSYALRLGAAARLDWLAESPKNAWEIAERAPMPLFKVDIHLYRVRLFGDVQSGASSELYPWGSPHKDLAEARRLIEKHGYGRRMRELEDAEATSGDRRISPE